MENENNFSRTSNKPRSKKLNPKIDLTALVSISFLLIGFYMVSIELSKPKIIELGLPETCYEYNGTSCGGNPDRVLTLLLDDNNKIISYQGLLEIPCEKPKKLEYGKDGIRRELLKKNKKIINQFDYSKQGVIVIIKPSKNSNFKNLVDILDEMSITNVATYAIINVITPEENKLLALN